MQRSSLSQPKSGVRAKNPESKNQKRIAKRTKENMSADMILRRDKFIDAKLQGCTNYQAALYAGCPARSSYKEGSTMAMEPYVLERFHELREAMEEAQLLSRKEQILNVKSIAFNERETGGARVGAHSLLAKILGHEAPTRIQAEVEHKGGVMMVPVASLSEWESASASAQAALKANVRT